MTGKDKITYAVDLTTGSLIWSYKLLKGSNNEGRLYALSLTDGSTVWADRPTTDGFWASAAVSQGGFYVTGLDGVLRSYQP